MGLLNFFFKKDNEKKSTQNAQQTATAAKQTTNEQSASYQNSIGASSEQPVKTPSTFDDIQMIIQDLKCGNSVLVNVSAVDFALGQRFVDVLSGAIVALDGLVTPIQKGLFYFSVKR